jgi:hypothetical protein
MRTKVKSRWRRKPALKPRGSTRNAIHPDRLFFRSFDRGRTWQTLDTPFLQQHGFCSIAVIGNGLLLGGRYGAGEIWRSGDSGETWTLVYAGQYPMMEVPKITLDRANPGIVWATIWPAPPPSDSGYVVKSTDRGLTWTAYPVFGSPWAIETDRLGRVFVGMVEGGTPGAIMSNNGGKTWTPLSGGLPATPETGNVWMLKSDGGLPGLYMADLDIGAFKLDNLMTSVSPSSNRQPHQFDLFQNHPNPFNPATTIRYSVPGAQRVTLKVFDTLGREVATLVDELKAAGSYEIDFDASRLSSSGVYIYRLKAGVFHLARKMVFVK